ncbi:MAG: DegT/DnrJ/EryC1/StrS family aminotransferase, partial [Pyrinomonadaceae bacterium]
AGYTALAILNAGGVPVFSDIDPDTYTLNPQRLDEAITTRTRAVVPVHLYGQMADMAGIRAVAARRDLFVIEDAAQSHGARLDGRRAGAHGHAAAFSFYPTKNLGAFGDGGAVVSDDAALIERVKNLRQGGHPSALDSEMAGRNSRLDEMQAALLRIKLRRLDAWNSERQRLAASYDELLKSSPVKIPSRRSVESHVSHLYVVRHPRRESLREHLAARGVETLIHYPYLLHRQNLFRRSEQRALPVAEGLVDDIFSLPLYPGLTLEEQREVADGILSFER